MGSKAEKESRNGETQIEEKSKVVSNSVNNNIIQMAAADKKVQGKPKIRLWEPLSGIVAEVEADNTQTIELLESRGYVKISDNKKGSWVLKVGNSYIKNDVIVLQKVLVKSGYLDMPWDPATQKRVPFGTYGELTKQAVMKFQRKKGLKADGIVGPDTWKAMELPWNNETNEPHRTHHQYKLILNNNNIYNDKNKAADDKTSLNKNKENNVSLQPNKIKDDTVTLYDKTGKPVKVKNDPYLINAYINYGGYSYTTQNEHNTNKSNVKETSNTQVSQPQGSFWSNIGNGLIQAAIAVKDFVTGVGAGVLESVSYGISRDLEVYYDRDNEVIYLIGKVIGNTAVGIVSGIATVESGALTVATSPTGVGAVVFGYAAVYCGTVTISAAGNAAVNVMQIVSKASSGGDSSKGTSKTTKGKQNVPDYINDNRVPLDKETILSSKDYIKTNFKVKGAQVYRKGDKYYCRDTFHKGEEAHLEVFDKRGNHLGEANPQTGEIIPGTADPTKKINVN